MLFTVRPLRASNIDHVGNAFDIPRGRNSILVELSHHYKYRALRAELIISRLTMSTEQNEES